MRVLKGTERWHVYGRLFRYIPADMALVEAAVVAAFDALPWDENPNECHRMKRAVVNVEGLGRTELYDYEYYCGDCGQMHPDLFMVWPDMWERYGNGRGILCERCLAKRVGRRLRRSDFRSRM